MIPAAPLITTSAAIRSTRLTVFGAANVAPSVEEGLLQTLLREQQTLTAVERFSTVHAQGLQPAQARYYRDLIPLEQPAPGQQYAFEVDMDGCTGCKACVSACHSLNGLDAKESWRTVGLLHGGTAALPAQQTVTTSCHHCVEPACLSGCPVKAYEKDPITGIVKHLDDQCFGCQYCTLMCPYDAPKFSADRGIVRKCDMCSARLAVGEAPACVQACPNEAIRISVVDQTKALQRSEAGTFLSGAPAPDHTAPTTLYNSTRPLPANMLPADFYAVQPEHAHAPLVVMLTLTQLAAGAFGLATIVDAFGQRLIGGAFLQAALSLSICFVALAASLFHLGRPHLAWKAFLGLRTSWLSREIVAFGAFAKLGALYTLCLVPEVWPEFPGRAHVLIAAPWIRWAAAAAGAAGVFCSVMVYAATKRPQWSAAVTGTKFFATTLILGASTVAAAALSSGGAVGMVRLLVGAVAVVAFVKLLFEASLLLHYKSRQHTPLRRVALVTLGHLAGISGFRFVAGTLGALVLPAVVLAALAHPSPNIAVAARAAALSSLLLLAGELAERYLFFRAAPGSRMPGGLR